MTRMNIAGPTARATFSATLFKVDGKCQVLLGHQFRKQRLQCRPRKGGPGTDQKRQAKQSPWRDVPGQGQHAQRHGYDEHPRLREDQ